MMVQSRCLPYVFPCRGLRPAGSAHTRHTMRMRLERSALNVGGAPSVCHAGNLRVQTREFNVTLLRYNEALDRSDIKPNSRVQADLVEDKSFIFRFVLGYMLKQIRLPFTLKAAISRPCAERMFSLFIIKLALYLNCSCIG